MLVLRVYGLKGEWGSFQDVGNVLFLGLGSGVTDVFTVWKFLEFYIYN